MFIGKEVFICLVGSVNSVLKFLGQPVETRFQPGGDEISSGVPMTFNREEMLFIGIQMEDQV